MGYSVNHYESVKNPFFMESLEEGCQNLGYCGRGERRYSIGRQLLVRSCHDALVSCEDKNNERGILLIKRKGDPARGYLWSLGGFFDRGIPSKKSLSSRIKSESGLDVDEESFRILGHVRAMWNTTPYQKIESSPKIKSSLYEKNLGQMTMEELFEFLKKSNLQRELNSLSVQDFADLVQSKNLPRGIDDTGLLFYCKGEGNISLDSLHEKPLIVTPNQYTEEFREKLHPYIQEGMDRAIKLI